MIRGVLLDISGVLYEGGQAVEGAAEAVARLRDSGLPVRFVTNSTRSPRRALLAKLAQMGFALDSAELFTPARAAVDLLGRKGWVPHLLIHPDLAEDFADLPQQDSPDAVVVGDAAQHFTYDAMNAAFRVLDRGAALLALAANRTFRDVDGCNSIDAGAFVRALEYAARTRATVLGKPSAEFFTAALDSMGCAAAEAVMVGDDAEADVAGALSAGLGAAVLVRTGKYRAEDAERADPPPTLVADDLPSAAAWILGD